MKKIIALVLALVMVLSLGTVAFAKTARNSIVVTNVVTKLLEGPAKSLGAVMKFNKTATVNAVNALAPVVVNNAKAATEKLGDVVIGASYLVEKKEISDTTKELKEAQTALDEAREQEKIAYEEAVAAYKEAYVDVDAKEVVSKAAEKVAEAQKAVSDAEAALAAPHDDNKTPDLETAVLLARSNKEKADEVNSFALAAKEITETITGEKGLLYQIGELQKDLDLDIPNTFSRVRTVANYAADYIFEMASVRDLAVGTAKAMDLVKKFINGKVKTGSTDVLLQTAGVNDVVLPVRLVVSELIPEALQAMVISLDAVTLEDFVDPDLDTYEKKMETIVEGIERGTLITIDSKTMTSKEALSLTLAELERSGKSYVATLTGEVIDAVSDILTKNSSYKMIDMDGTDLTAQGGVITTLVGYLMGLDRVTK